MEAEESVEPGVEAVVVVAPRRLPVGLVEPAVLVALGPYYLAVLAVHDERVELVLRRWLDVICGGAEEACCILLSSRWDEKVGARM